MCTKQCHKNHVAEKRYPLLAMLCLIAGLVTSLGATAAEVQVSDAVTIADRIEVPSEWRVRPAMATDGNGNWLIAWPQLDPVGGDYDLFAVQYSETEGYDSIQQPVPVNTTATTDSGDDQSVALAYDSPSGAWLAVWETDEDIQAGWEIAFARGTYDDEGSLVWSEPVAVNHNETALVKIRGKVSEVTSKERSPSIASDGAGKWLVVWSRTYYIDDPHNKLFASLYDGTEWSEDIPVCDADFFPTYTDVAYCDGTWVDEATWVDGTWVIASMGTDVHAYVSSSGYSWEERMHAGTGVYYSGRGPASVATDGNGHWIVAWRSDTDGQINFSASVDGATTWTAERPVSQHSDAERVDYAPDVAADGEGNWLMSFSSYGGFAGLFGADDDEEIFTYSSADFGQTWAGPVVMPHNAMDDGLSCEYLPRLGKGQDNRWVSTWYAVDWDPAVSGPWDSTLDLAVAEFPPAPGTQGISAGPDYEVYVSKGTPDHFTVALDEVPNQSVVVPITVIDKLGQPIPDEITVNPDGLTFTDADFTFNENENAWICTGKTVGVSVAADSVLDGAKPFIIQVGAPEDQYFHAVPIYGLYQPAAAVAGMHVADPILYASVKRDLDLEVTITILDDADAPVAGATVSAELELDGVTITIVSAQTDAAGIVTIYERKAASGTYVTVINDVTADGLAWDGLQPAGNSFTK